MEASHRTFNGQSYEPPSASTRFNTSRHKNYQCCNAKQLAVSGILITAAATLITGVALALLNGNAPLPTALMAAGGAAIVFTPLVLGVKKCNDSRKKSSGRRLGGGPAKSGATRVLPGAATLKKQNISWVLQIRLAIEGELAQKQEDEKAGGAAFETATAILVHNWKVCKQEAPGKKSWTLEELAPALTNSRRDYLNSKVKDFIVEVARKREIHLDINHIPTSEIDKFIQNIQRVASGKKN